MKKIIISLSLIAAMGAIVAGGTYSFFYDTETSMGNTFTAGSLDLTIDNYSYYNGNLVESWGMDDLTDERFFDLNDIKPGDWGQFRISMHIDDNPAWMCLIVGNKQDDDNGLTDPEEEAGDSSGGAGQGELSSGIDVFIWREHDGDGIYEPGNGETPVIETELVSMNLVSVADSLTGAGPIIPENTSWLGMQWCAGTQTVNYLTGAISCNGSGMGDMAQTDSFTADLSLYVEQHRNNPDFQCQPD